MSNLIFSHKNSFESKVQQQVQVLQTTNTPANVHFRHIIIIENLFLADVFRTGVNCCADTGTPTLCLI